MAFSELIYFIYMQACPVLFSEIVYFYSGKIG